MQKLKVNLEKAPTRCEICHKDDLFDGFSGTCQRCKNISLSIPKPSLSQINETEMMAMEKEMPLLENLIQNLGQLLEGETIVFSLMVLSAILFALFPEQIGENKGSIKLAICCISFIISIDSLFDRVEGPAKAMRIWLMMVTFCSYERLIRLLMEN
ncbi:MAG: hypothetical protein WAQ98_22135 [Blastocatellia bacterium]